MGLVDISNISSNTYSNLFKVIKDTNYIKYYESNGELPREFFVNILSILIEDLKLYNYITGICFDDNSEILENESRVINPAAYNSNSKHIIICPYAMDRHSVREADHNGFMYGDDLSILIETLFVLGHEVEHANQNKKKDNIVDNESALLGIVGKYPSYVFKDKNQKIVKNHFNDIYRSFYDIVPAERLANFYSACRVYLMGYYSNNDKLKIDGLRRIYKSILQGYGMDEICDSNINVDGVERYAPSIKYLSEILCCSEYDAKALFDRYIKDLDEDEKLKLGLIVDDKHLDNSKSLYNRLNM